MKKNFLLILFAMCLASPTWAQTTFTEGGITYNIVDADAKTVEVGSNLSYSGALTIPDGVEYGGETYTIIGIADHAFSAGTSSSHASLTSVVMSDNITYIGEYAFYYNNSTLTSISLSKNLTSIGTYAFYYCHEWAGALVIPDGVTTIEDHTFDGCASLTSLDLNNVVTINQLAFNGCTSLTNLVIPNSVVTIGYRAFYNYDSTSIVIGSSVETIGDEAFDDTDYLTSIITLNPTPPTIGSNEFDWASATVHVPAGTVEEYERVWGSSSSSRLGIIGYDELEYTVLKITLSDDNVSGYATYYNGSYDTTIPEGIKAYWAESVEDDAVTLTEIEEVIPANTAVVIAGNLTNYAEATASTPSADASAYEGNLLHGQPTTGDITPLTGDYLYYMLTTNTSGANVGFYWGVDGGGAFSSKANKAWLAVPQTEATSALSIKFKDKEDETTGISSIEVDGESNSLNNGAIYTIQGVRVSNMNQPGLYIVDGKKVLVK